MFANSRVFKFAFSLRKPLLKRFCSNQEDKEILITCPTPYFTKLTMNRPASLNALTYTMCKTIHELTAEWNKSQAKVNTYIWTKIFKKRIKPNKKI